MEQRGGGPEVVVSLLDEGSMRWNGAALACAIISVSCLQATEHAGDDEITLVARIGGREPR